MRSSLLGVVGLFAVLAAVSACGEPANQAQASNRAGEWIEVVPSTVSAGSLVQIRAKCEDNTTPATVTSKAFGTVTIQPQYGVLFKEVQIPPRTAEGANNVALRCRSGAQATTTLWVVAKSPDRPTTGPHTGGGFLANHGGANHGGDGIDRLAGPVGWLAGGAITLMAAAVTGVVSVRRRRRRLAR